MNVPDVVMINSDVEAPVNHLLWLHDYKVYGESSYVWNDKEKLHELYASEAVNDKAIYSEAFVWLNENMDGHMRAVLTGFAPFRTKEMYAKEWLKDMISEDVFDANIWEDIFSRGFVDFFLMSNLYGKLKDKGTVSEAFRILYHKMNSAIAESLKACSAWLNIYSDDNPGMDEYKRSDEVACDTGIEIRASMFLVSVQTGAGGNANLDTIYRYHGSAAWESRDGVSHVALRSGFGSPSNNPGFATDVRIAAINDFASFVSVTAASTTAKKYGNNKILAYVFDNLAQKETT